MSWKLGGTLGVVTVAAAIVTAWAGSAVQEQKTSKPDFVSSACTSGPNVEACAVALRYLAALDLDRAEVACGLLAPSTLEQAGGIDGCTETLLAARGTRIRYAIVGARRSTFGRSVVRFTTQARPGSPLPQLMIVDATGHIVAVVPEP